MTPSERETYVRQTVRNLHLLADELERLADLPYAPIDALAKVHDLAPEVAVVRNRFATLKADLAATAKDSYTHEQIAERLGVSKPYVQQMVYRGRA